MKVVKIKIQKTQKTCRHKSKVTFENYKSCLKATQHENKIKQLKN